MEMCIKCKDKLRAKYDGRGRRAVKRSQNSGEPIVYSDEYRAMVYKILQEKRRRDVIADILAKREAVAGLGE